MTPWSTSRKSEIKYRRVLIVTSVLAVMALILSLILLIVDRLRFQEALNSFWSHSTYDIKEDPWEYNLSKNNFSISRVPTTRYYEWTVSQHVYAPDGFERPMLLVNGKPRWRII